MIKLIVGLGNIGAKYDNTRHNIGFMVTDLLADKLSLDFRSSDKFNGAVAAYEGDESRVYFLKPHTFMNLSGRAVYSLSSYYKILPSEILVIHDEMNIDYGRLKFKNGGSAAGHNGISSIIECMGDKDFVRLKMGIGRRAGGGDVTGHVLGKFSPEENKELDIFVKHGADAVVYALKHGMLKAMSEYNCPPL